MSSQLETSASRCWVGVAAGQQSEYTVKLAIADQPVKPSRRTVRCISATVIRNGEPVVDADVSIGFHPLHAGPSASASSWHPSELLLTHDHHPQARPEELHGSLALDGGCYQVDVTVNREASAGFVLEM